MSGEKVALSAQDQLAGVQDLLARINSEIEAGASAHDPQQLAQLNRDRGILTAVATTLGWLTRNREGCVALLTTRWKIQGD